MHKTGNLPKGINQKNWIFLTNQAIADEDIFEERIAFPPNIPTSCELLKIYSEKFKNVKLTEAHDVYGNVLNANRFRAVYIKK